jgi:hypothetical protein
MGGAGARHVAEQHRGMGELPAFIGLDAGAGAARNEHEEEEATALDHGVNER